MIEELAAAPATPAAAAVSPEGFTLTQGQENALQALLAFFLDPVERFFVLKGFAGCGKSTLVRTFLDRFPKYQHTLRLINPNAEPLELLLTATTNKAAENLAQITGMEVKTIHSALGLRIKSDVRTGKTELVTSKNSFGLANKLFVVDEASYVDSELLEIIAQLTSDRCKVVFVGDPAQLVSMKTVGTAPVFLESNGWPTAELTQVVRQAEGNPILDLCTQLRGTVSSGDWFQFTPDGVAIRHVDRQEFDHLIGEEFSRTGWRYSDSKVLAWTNKAVESYNRHIRQLTAGDPDLQVGDYASVNSFVSQRSASLKTDQLVHITRIRPTTECRGVLGNYVELDHRAEWFLPRSLAAKQEALKRFRASDNLDALFEIESWVDLRAVFAQTIDKSQGSTYGKVFIDLSDIARCNQGERIARMLYVGASRAKNQVVFTGDLA